ncbi:uncharacterized protein LOC103953913 isoform X5 [Pyrus x bretschneideri]|uniref:uncharacterized protein LOC103953913 isoform X5 n=1 Tax=Pyrus x bretschneideri TaxID=225117 RepID=UPI00202FCC05|nr:uncharacterized protein LOC103953913 isoform X5 [Pyrus x bretschneideri]
MGGGTLYGPVDICEQELATNAAACSLFPASLSPRRLLSSSGRKNHAYQKLPQEPLTLFVIKLDGSSFEIQVSKTATVAELNEAVKDVFSQSSIDEMISWSEATRLQSINPTFWNQRWR